jgi:hypothetical protein
MRRVSPAEVAEARAQGFGDLFALVAEHGDWLEVESVEVPLGSHCQPINRELDPLRIRFFVRRQDALSVIKRVVRLDFADGTAATLAPGLTVTARDDGGHVVHTRGFAPTWRLPSDALGHAYKPEALPPNPASGARQLVASADLAAGVVRCGGAPLPRQASAKGEGQAVQQLRETAAGTLVTVGQPCARFEALVPAARLSKHPGPFGVMGGIDGAARGRPAARPGATAYFRSGRPAGRVRATASFLREAEPVEGRRCFLRALHTLGTRALCDDPRCLLPLCFDRKDVWD